MAETVSISRAYLDTLLRREEPHHTDHYVKISVAHHQSLVRDATQLKSLKAALISGGISDEALQLLLGHDSSSEGEDHSQNNIANKNSRKHGTIFDTETLTEQGFRSRNRANGRHFLHPRGVSRPQTPSTLEWSDNEQGTNVITQNFHCKDSYADRSLVIEGLPRHVSLLDVTSIIRGGTIFNIHLRRKEQAAHVSFFEPEAAASFLEYSKYHGIIVKNQSVKIRWDRQQLYVPGWIMNRVLCQGATRNLVVRFPKQDITIETIKEDLAHIYRLEVIDIKLQGGRFWIQLNNIQHALNAKTCMQSRLKYKGSKIEFFPDECNTSLTGMVVGGKEKFVSHASRSSEIPVLPLSNRFESLLVSFDSDEEDT